MWYCVVCLQSLNWNDLLAKRIKPPFVPKIVSFFCFGIFLVDIFIFFQYEMKTCGSFSFFWFYCVTF